MIAVERFADDEHYSRRLIGIRIVSDFNAVNHLFILSNIVMAVDYEPHGIDQVVD